MAWGVLDDHKMALVPGTAVLSEQCILRGSAFANTVNLKKRGQTVLAPQPSNSPNDPLNWPIWQRNIIIFTLAFASGITVGMLVMLTPAFYPLTVAYHLTFSSAFIFLLGTPVLATGIATFFTSAAATIWGKRPVFLISLLILLACCIWGFFSKSFVSLAALRIVQGLASAPVETLVTSTVADIFFVHQRGTRMALWALMTLGAVCLGPLISGTIVDDMALKWTFAFCGAFVGIVLLAMFFLVPETAYSRPRQEGIGLIDGNQTVPEQKHETVVDIVELNLDKRPEQKLSYRARLRIFNGRLSGRSYWKTVIKPFSLCLYPAVLFSTVIYGSFHTWMVVFALVHAKVLTAAPYHLHPSQMGLTNLPSFGVGVLSIMFAGWIADWIARYMSRHGNGVYEPEFRLLLMVPAIIFSTVGFVGFGFCVEEHAPLWQVLLFSALYHVAIPFATAASHTYIVDCHQQNANEAFVLINFTKAVLTFSVSWYAEKWLDKAGAKKMFVTIGMINVMITIMTIPTYVYGKRFRSYVARTRVSKKRSE